MNSLWILNLLILGQPWDIIPIRPENEEAPARFASFYTDSLYGSRGYQQILQQTVWCLVTWSHALCASLGECSFYGIY